MATCPPIDVGYAVVHWSNRPTENDPVGRDGFYVERVELKPMRQWPLKAHAKVWPHVAGRIGCALWHRIRHRFA